MRAREISWVAFAASAILVGLALAQAETRSTRQGAWGAPLRDAPTRRLYVTTDKPLYRPGEAIWFRAWETSGPGLTMRRNVSEVTAELVGPGGETVAEKRLRAGDGTIANDFVLAADIAGGSYRLRLRSDSGAETERELHVALYEVPRLQKTLTFDRESYGASDRVAFSVAVIGPTGDPIRGARVSAAFHLDGNQVRKVGGNTGRDGRVHLRFYAPAHLGAGDGLLTVSIRHGGSTETMQRRVPLVISDVQVGLFPEGGDLVAGIPTRVYVRAQSPRGEPVDLSGDVVDARGKTVATIRTDLRGMARFDLEPRRGESYELRVRRPLSLRRVVPIPQTRPEGCVLGAAGELTYRVACSETRQVALIASLQGERLARIDRSVGPAGATITVPSPRNRGGVVVATLLREGEPVAERLTYVGRGAGLRVTITPDRDTYTPRDRARLTIETRGADGEPVAADLALAVVDESVLALADSDAGHIIAQLTLEREMPGQVVRDPNFYFSEHPDAGRALDLLLGTQGWRRFRRRGADR